MEPEAIKIVNNSDYAALTKGELLQTRAIVSIAFSLKRIADEFSPGENQGLRELIEVIAVKTNRG